MKILYQLLIISLFPLAIVLGINYYQSEQLDKVHKENTQNHLINIEKNLLELLNKKNQQYKQFLQVIKTNELLSLIENRDNNALYSISKKYIRAKLFSQIVFIDKDGFVIARGNDEYKFNDNIKDTILKDFFNKKDQFSGIIYFDDNYHLVSIIPIYKYDVDFVGYMILGETIDKNFLDSLNINQYFLKMEFDHDKVVNNFTEEYFDDNQNHISYKFDLEYERLYNINKAPSITIYKNYNNDTLIKKSSLTLSNIIIAILIILPIIIWYFTYRAILPLNKLNLTLLEFMHNNLPLFDTINKLKEIQTNTKETKLITTSILSTLDKLYKSQNALLQEKRKSQESDKMKSDFIEDINLQIKRPLNSIINFGDILFKTKLDKVQENYLNTIIKSSYTLKSTFDDIVDLSKISYGTMEFDNKATKIGELINELEAFFKIDIENKSLSLEILIDTFDNDHTINIDKERLKKILIKIITNAIKYTFSGQIRILFEVSRVDYGKNLADFNISISDTGIGINDEDLVRILSSFNQSHIQYDKKHGPFGLGLSIANKLIKLMDGEIKINAQSGKGSVFTLYFKNRKFEKNTYKIKRINKRKKTVVIADANSKNRVFIQKYFSNNFTDINILKTSNGYDTIKQCFNDNEHPTLIIINLNLRSIDALKVLDYIKSNSHTDSINIIVIKQNDKINKKLIKYDLIDTIQEPLDEDALESTFRKVRALLDQN